MSYAASKTTGRRYRITDKSVTELSIPYVVRTPRLGGAPDTSELTGFPALGSTPALADLSGLASANRTALLMTDVDVSEDESGAKWIFTAVYKVPSNGAAGGAPATATSYQSRLTAGTRLVEIESAYDMDGRLFLNSAGRPYDKPPMIRVPARVMTVEKHLKAYLSVSGHSGTANASTVTIAGETFPAGTAILDATCESTGDKDWPFKLRFTIEELIQIDDQGENTGCRVNIVNSGYEYRTAEGDLMRASVADENGKSIPSPTPVLLDASGMLLEEGGDPTSEQYILAKESTWPNWVSA